MNNFPLSKGQKVLFLWKSGSSTENLQITADKLQELIGSEGKLQLENEERLLLGKLSSLGCKKL